MVGAGIEDDAVFRDDAVADQPIARRAAGNNHIEFANEIDLLGGAGATRYQRGAPEPAQPAFRQIDEPRQAARPGCRRIGDTLIGRHRNRQCERHYRIGCFHGRLIGRPPAAAARC
jgi:hypothetical protein